jgi:TRAP-type mannitol/chloroaromatic compound transport system permease large subunit
MDPVLIGILGILVLILVLFLVGMPVGFAMAVVGFCGFSYVVSFQAAANMIATDIWSTFSGYGLTVIPLFIFMGYLAFNL